MDVRKVDMPDLAQMSLTDYLKEFDQNAPEKYECYTLWNGESNMFAFVDTATRTVLAASYITIPEATEQLQSAGVL